MGIVDKIWSVQKKGGQCYYQMASNLSLIQFSLQICSWVQENGGWSRVLHSGLNVMQQTAVIGTCVAVFACCMIYIRKNW